MIVLMFAFWIAIDEEADDRGKRGGGGSVRELKFTRGSAQGFWASHVRQIHQHPTIPTEEIACKEVKSYSACWMMGPDYRA